MLKSHYPGGYMGQYQVQPNFETERYTIAQQRRGTSTSAMMMNSYFTNQSPGSQGYPFMRPSSDQELLIGQFMHNYKQQQHNHQLMLMAHHNSLMHSALSERTATQMHDHGMMQQSPRTTTNPNSNLGGSQKRPVNLPSIIKQSQTPMMKPFRSKASKAIKNLKQQQREFGLMNSSTAPGTTVGSQQSYRFPGGSSSALDGNISFYKRMTMMSNVDDRGGAFSPNPPNDVEYENCLQSKSVKPQVPFRFPKNLQNQSNLTDQQMASQLNPQLMNLPIEQTASNSIINGGFGELDNMGQSASPQTAGTNRSNPHNANNRELSSIGREGQASLKAIYHHPHRSPMTIKDFNEPFPAMLNGANCLVPVTENEERSIKAQVTLRKLKLDLDMNKEGEPYNHKSGISSKLGTNSKKESQTQINVFSAEMLPTDGHAASTFRENGGSISITNNYPINYIAVKEKLNILDGMDSSRLQLRDETPQMNRFKEIKLPGNITQNNHRAALPARENPMQLAQTQKTQALVVNFSKYKQLKKFNDSLMRIQQEMVTALKQDKLRDGTKEGRVSQATEYEDKQNKLETPGPVTLEMTEGTSKLGETITGGVAELGSESHASHSEVEENGNLKEQVEVPATTNSFVPQLTKKVLADTGNFTYGHHKFVPRKTYMATKKEMRTFYQHTMRETDLNDAALDVRQAQLEDRYQAILDRERHNQDELKKQLKFKQGSRDKVSASQKDMQTSIQNQSGVQEPQADGEDQSPTDDTAVEVVNEKGNSEEVSGKEEVPPADVHVVVHQNEYMQRQQERNLAKREKMDTLQNLNVQKRSSTMSGGIGSQASSVNVPAPPPKFNNNASSSPPQSPGFNNNAPTFSASSNRVIVVHKQHSGKNSPVAQKTGHAEQEADQKLKLVNNRRSKSVLEHYPIDIYEKIKNNKEEIERVYRQITQLQSELSNQNKRSMKVPEPVLVPEIKAKKLPDFPDLPKQVLQVNSCIVKDLEHLREQQRIAKLNKQHVIPKPQANPLKFFQTELTSIPHQSNDDHKVKIHDDLTLSPRTMDMPTPSALPQPIMDYSFNLPPQNVARERVHNRVPQTLSDDQQQQQQFSLNFPMRNSRLSQAVMASLTIDGNSHRLLQQSVAENEASKSGGANSPTIVLMRQKTNEMALGPNPTATFSVISPKGAPTPAHVIQPLSLQSSAERKKSSKALLVHFNLDFNQEAEEVAGESIFTEAFENADKFIKSYFKKDLGFFKEADTKMKMIIVRKVVAMLEREHFNKQTALNIKEDKLNSARSNKMTHLSSKQSPPNSFRST